MDLQVAAYANKAINTLARTFGQHAETLKKLRTTGEQKMTVEHRHYHLASGAIGPGSQAVLGDVTGASGALIENEGQSHERMLRISKNGTVVPLSRGQQFHQFPDSWMRSAFGCLVELICD